MENRLVSASGAKNATLRYDPLGRLYEVAATSATRRFLYDGDALMSEYDTAGTLMARYIHADDAGADDPLVWFDGLALRWLHPDHQGSIVAVTNGSGQHYATNAYDAWGVPNAGNIGRFQYTGQMWLAELGLYHYKARVYSPYLGRFLQTDPVGYEGGINLYAYVGNDPVNRVDPGGECGVDARGQPVGVCPVAGPRDYNSSDGVPDVGSFVQQRLDDPTSDISAVDQEAIEAGRLIGVRFDDQSFGPTQRNGEFESVEGEMTETGTTRNSPIIVTIDPKDSVRVVGRNEGSSERVERETTLEDRAEHAIVGHARDMMRGRRGDERAIDAENERRRRNNDPFRRIGHGGIRGPR